MNTLKGAMFLVMLFFHIFIFKDSRCLAEPSISDTVSVSFDARLSPTFIDYWNTHSMAFDGGEGYCLSDFYELFNSSVDAAFLGERSDNEELLCLGQVLLSADSLYQVQASWLVNDSDVVHSMTLHIASDLGVQNTKSSTYTSSLQAKSSRFETLPSETSIIPSLLAGTYSGGSGSESDPYLVATAEDLITLSLNSSDWNKSFLQTENIIFSSDYVSEDWNGDGSINSSDNYGMQPIGTTSVPFSGTFDGGDYRIKYLLIDNGDDYTGMFGYCSGATLSGIGLAAVYVNGWYYVGGLVGYCKDNCLITQCYTTGTVSGFRDVGGLVGYIKASTVITQCISTCSVDGFLYVAGLVGRTKGSDVIISNSVTSGSVDGFVYTAGMIGSSGSATVENVYSSTEVDGAIGTGGLIANSGNGEVTDAYWDVEVSGVSSSAGSDAEGLTSEEMTDSTLFEDWDTDVWTFDPDLNDGLPVIDDQSDFYEPVETEFVGTGTWDDPDNWTNGVPDEEEITTAIISGECDIDDLVAVENLIIENGGVLTVDDNGEVSVDGDITIVSDSTGSGEYYSSTGGGIDVVEQEKYFAAEQWTFISTPVTMTADALFPNLNLAASWTDPLGDYWVAEYSEDKRAISGSGMENIFDGDDLIEAGKGYMVWVKEDQVGVYQHLLSTSVSAVYTACSSNSSIHNSGWNLVGNPFTYTMTYDDVFDCEYNKANYTGAVYLWDGYGYKTWVDGVGDAEASEVAPLEAFFIKRTAEGDGYFCMAKGDCECTALEVKSSSVALEDEEVGEVLSISVRADNESDNTYLRILEGDITGKGAQKFELNNTEKPIIYSLDTAGNPLAVNALNVDEKDSIPLVINLQGEQAAFELYFSPSGTVSYAYVLFDAFADSSYAVSVDDTLLFSAEGEQSISDRFSLHIEALPPGQISNLESVEIPTPTLVKMCSVNEALLVTSLVDESIAVKVFALDGHLEQRFSLIHMEHKYVDLKPGAYIIRLSSKTTQETQKVLHF